VFGRAPQPAKVHHANASPAGGSNSLYIDLSHRTSAESRELSEGVVLDYDESGHIVGIDIDNANPNARFDQFHSGS
jgi:hypothetical protein